MFGIPASLNRHTFFSWVSVLNPNDHITILFPSYLEPLQTNSQPDLAVASFCSFPTSNVRVQHTDMQCTCSPLPFFSSPLPFSSPTLPLFSSPPLLSFFLCLDFFRAECCCIRSNSWSPGKAHSKASQLVRIFFIFLSHLSFQIISFFSNSVDPWLDFIYVERKKCKITWKGVALCFFFLRFTFML